MTPPSNAKVTSQHAVIVGVGLIGGSIGMGLRSAGWVVHGVDLDQDALRLALTAGAIDAIGHDTNAELVVVATPSGRVPAVLEELLKEYQLNETIFTDAAGVKSRICASITDHRFIGGHPMAGSEQSGISGARGDLFVGASWVLTPGPTTSPEQYSRLLSILRTLGAQGLALAPEDHDRLVALVSHVPHLVAASLMNEAARAAESDVTLLQLAAGGFRDMTRIAAGDPQIWPDVCLENGDAILESLDDLTARIGHLREIIASGNRSQLHAALSEASRARNSLPGRTVAESDLRQVRIPVPDRAGVLAEVTGIASDAGVGIFDLEIAHGIEGDRGVLILVINSSDATVFHEILDSKGFTSSSAPLR